MVLLHEQLLLPEQNRDNVGKCKGRSYLHGMRTHESAMCNRFYVDYNYTKLSHALLYNLNDVIIM